MSTLSTLQHHFQRYLLSGEANLEQSIVGTKFISAQMRLNIYRNAYQLRLIEALASNFPNLKRYLGEDGFHQMSLAYIEAHPSNYRSIRWVGSQLPAYLIHYFDKEYQYLTELAQFEWNMTLAFDASDTPIVQLEQVSAIPVEAWGGMILKAHPSVHRMHFFWEVITLWEALHTNKIPRDVMQNPAGVPWVLWRQDYLNRFSPLEADEAWAMDLMLTGVTFSELCEGLCQWHDENAVGMRAASLLKRWIQTGKISEILF